MSKSLSFSTILSFPGVYLRSMNRGRFYTNLILRSATRTVSSAVTFCQGCHYFPSTFTLLPWPTTLLKEVS